MVDPTCRDQRMIDLWNRRLPLKIQIFLWMLFHDQLQTAVQLKCRKWEGPKDCKVSGRVEDLDHLFFRYLVLCVIRLEMLWGGFLVQLP